MTGIQTEETSIGGWQQSYNVKFLLFPFMYFLSLIFSGETRAELHIDQANGVQSALKMESQNIKLFNSLFVIFAINYKLLEKHRL